MEYLTRLVSNAVFDLRFDGVKRRAYKLNVHCFAFYLFIEYIWCIWDYIRHNKNKMSNKNIINALTQGRNVGFETLQSIYVRYEFISFLMTETGLSLVYDVEYLCF